MNTVMKINRLEIENVKRVNAVRLEPAADGLTIIGGDNNQGKTSVLDSIAWALGGDKYRPSASQREGSAIPPRRHIGRSNGLVGDRRGKNSDLKVTDPAGKKGGQQLLNEFVEQLALDLPRFMEASGQEKARTLLRIIGVGDRLEGLERQEKELYSKRLAIGQIADQKAKFAKEQPYYPDAPESVVSPMDLIRQQQDILARNGENQRKRDKADKLQQSVAFMRSEVESLQRQLERKREELVESEASLNVALMDAEDLQDMSTAELEESIASIEEVNRKVRANLDKEKAEEDALEYRNQYSGLTAEIDKVRKDRMEILQSAELPLPGLSVDGGELVYNGQKWDCMSGSDRLKVATAIVRKLNPKCGFVLLDKLEQMDLKTLREFGTWLEQEGLQAIATRVSTGGECSIVISDGYVAGQEHPTTEERPAVQQETRTGWKAGEF